MEKGQLCHWFQTSPTMQVGVSIMTTLPKHGKSQSRAVSQMQFTKFLHALELETLGHLEVVSPSVRQSIALHLQQMPMVMLLLLYPRGWGPTLVTTLWCSSKH